MHSSDIPLVSAARTVLITVSNLAASRRFYEEGLGLRSTGEASSVEFGLRNLWGLGAESARVLRLEKPGEPFGALELIEYAGSTGQTIRNPQRPFDFGLLTLNFTAFDLSQAMLGLCSLGATVIAEPRTFAAIGNSVTEAVVQSPGGERLTLLQAGEANTDAPHPIKSAVATVGMVVPSLADAEQFYCEALGLTVAMKEDKFGGAFTDIMAVPEETRMQMLLVTSGKNWTGKLMTYELTPPQPFHEPRTLHVRKRGHYTGHWMLSLLTPALEQFINTCLAARVPILHGPMEVERPFLGRVKAVIVNAPGDVPMEVIQS